MDDAEILERIHAIVDEEHELRSAGHADAEKLERLEEALDQCWDLLRQRRAREEFGGDAEFAQPRDTDTVERYQQ